jgi:hypothetical protein
VGIDVLLRLINMCLDAPSETETSEGTSAP